METLKNARIEMYIFSLFKISKAWVVCRNINEVSQINWFKIKKRREIRFSDHVSIYFSRLYFIVASKRTRPEFELFCFLLTVALLLTPEPLLNKRRKIKKNSSKSSSKPESLRVMSFFCKIFHRSDFSPALTLYSMLTALKSTSSQVKTSSLLSSLPKRSSRILRTSIHLEKLCLIAPVSVILLFAAAVECKTELWDEIYYLNSLFALLLIRNLHHILLIWTLRTVEFISCYLRSFSLLTIYTQLAFKNHRHFKDRLSFYV